MSVETDAAMQRQILLDAKLAERVVVENVTPTYSPHQLLTGGGIPPTGEYVDRTPTAPEPTVEHFPIGEADAHAGTYTLGREDA